jgi:hypothetical protein
VQKLTLSVDPKIASRAKAYAKRNGTSVSRIVEAYLAVLTKPTPDDDVPPVLRQLRGTLKRKPDIADYYRYLSEKYR